MTRKKGKSVSFDAMVKFFMRNYDIPTKDDVDRLIERMDRIENLIRTTSGLRGRTLPRNAGEEKNAAKKPVMTGSDQVLEVIKRFRQGVSFGDVQERTGFEAKKLRNVIFRLNKLGKIKSKRRGVYIAV